MMTGYEANYYSAMVAAMPRIANALERIADQLEKLEESREKPEWTPLSSKRKS